MQSGHPKRPVQCGGLPCTRLSVTRWTPPPKGWVSLYAIGTSASPISITSYYSISSVSTHARGKSLAAVAVCPVSGAGSPATRYSRSSSIHAAYDNDSFHTCAERKFTVFQDIFSGCIQHCPTHTIAWT